MNDHHQLAGQVAAAALRTRTRVAVAESLTGGMLSSSLAAADQASSWFRGAVIAYASDVKYEVLGVPAGPVVSSAAAEAMVGRVAQLLRADVAVALTGVGGPEPQDGQPPGTVWFGIHRDGVQRSRLKLVQGSDPGAICANACSEALRLLVAELQGEHT